MKTACSTLVLVLLFAMVQAQAPVIQWQKTLGTNFNEGVGTSVQPTADGGYITAGYASSIFFVIKTDSLGEQQWQKELGGSSQDQAFSILQTKDGGYIVAGYTYSNDGDVSGNHGDSDFWVVKLDALGNLLWQKALGTSHSDGAVTVVETNDGGYAIAGNTINYQVDNPGQQNVDENFLIFKLDQAGNMQWVSILGGMLQEHCTGMLQTADNEFILVGYRYDNTDYFNSSDCLVAKFNNSGNVVWEKTFGGSNDDKANSISASQDGQYLITGTTASTDGNVTGNHGGHDGWLFKVNSTGNLTWQKCYGDAQDQEFYQGLQTNEGHYIIRNGFYTNVLKLDIDGNIIWEVAPYQPVGNGDYMQSLAQTPDKGYILTGYKRISLNYKSVQLIKLGPDTAKSLPVVLKEFAVIHKGADGLLTWKTASESQLGHFLIERSLDGKNFISIGRVGAIGNSNQPLTYQFTDVKMPLCNTFYRVVMVEKDGSKNYSGILVLTQKGQIQPTVKISPNPAINVLQINADMGISNISIIDILGHIVITSRQNSSETVNINVSQLHSGKYMLVATLVSGKTEAKAFIKQ